MTPSPKKPSVVMREDGVLEIMGGVPDPSPEARTERKSISTKCGHVKRRLVRDEPLTGALLEFALDTVGDERIAAKLKAGQKLSDYELHLMVDVFLLHKRLGAR